MYEIKTPDMKRSRDVSNRVIDGILAGTMDIKTANAVTGATNNLIRSFGNDLKARLALPELLEFEAKLVSGEAPAKGSAPKVSAPKPR